MSPKRKSPEWILREVREAFQQEWVHLQIVGRALTPDELRRSDALGRAIPLLDQALATLEEPGPAVPGEKPSGRT